MIKERDELIMKFQEICNKKIEEWEIKIKHIFKKIENEYENVDIIQSFIQVNKEFQMCCHYLENNMDNNNGDYYNTYEKFCILKEDAFVKEYIELNKLIETLRDNIYNIKNIMKLLKDCLFNC